MPCMCGDTYCWSCGPAQGNYKCEGCGRWSEDGGCKTKRKCKKIIEKMVAEEAKLFVEEEAYIKGDK